MLCFLLLPAYASSIPNGTYTLTGVSVGNARLSGTVTLGANGLATSANLTYANATYGSPSFTNIVSTGSSGNNPAADFAYISGLNGQVTLYYFATADPSGGIMLCEAGSGCTVASSLQVYSPNFQANLTGGNLTGAAAAAPELSSWLLVMTGALMIGVVLYLRRLPAMTVAVRSV